jgi:hypothetical protein
MGSIAAREVVSEFAWASGGGIVIVVSKITLAEGAIPTRT